ncbi:Tyrosyl-DNA phosphodiesterase 2 (Tyr-DNA phosphodiesterase 2) (5'-tyrosyl-DNA phosphodiesterase) (5'-Tyr-DNA phosphodiesterase) (TRAF and TNF receptor-associated protein) [Durusdinium trenchii]|uniref:Tyrosyl-DNA phosphodiesterase 2 (Tyr-DNA phosphodiesterase 2) (5'-tyrosyl-DNA phosphodiesterase) (5'-Tyr-DNA phosphodiesterase) (TRAF and TNF receptor-associated protein) n=1 Tax=Durusdinium trenchii TaxID=1381693 RepID=A0ABP0MBL4_9DINO
MALRLLTFNIWFSPHEMERRMQAIGDIVARTQPDLVALQEMTQDHWALLASHEAVGSYSWSESPRQRYYTLIGSRLPMVTTPQRFPFKASRMQRDLLTVTVKPPELPALVFATSHLESLDEHQERRRQMQESLQGHLKSADDVVFCGDTNINEAIDGEIRLPEGWKDPWILLRGDEGGYTFDVERNSMMAEVDSWARSNHARLRFDRFWIKVSNYAPVAIELLDDPIQEKLWPSDHFALLLTLEEWRRHRGDLPGKPTCSLS